MARSKKKIIWSMIAVIMCFVFTFYGCSLFSSEEETEETTYKIMYAYNDTTYTITVKHGELWYLETIPVKDGYTFTGLYDAESGGVQYASSYGMCISAFYDDKNIVLYPQFAASQYSVSLNYGESSGTLSSVAADYDGDIPELPAGLTISGKDYMVFAGWYTEENCGGIQVADSSGKSLVKMDSTLRALCNSSNVLQLYAGFTIKSYTVNFYSENGTNLIHTAIVEYGTDFADISTGIEVDGKTVSQWTAYKNGNVAYSGKVDYDLNVYALAYTVTVNYDYNDGSEISSKTVSYGESVTIPSSMERAGYTFLGWYDSDGVQYSGTMIPAKNMTLTAKWSANTYTVALNANDGDVTASSYTITYGSTFTLAVPTRTGYTFSGWYHGNTQVTDGDGAGISGWNIAENVTLTAKWSLNTYTVVLNANGGKVSTTTYNIGYGSSYTLAVPTRTGYTFDGWYYGSTQMTSSSGVSLSVWNKTSDATFTAKWTANTYTVTLDANGGTVTTSGYTVTYGNSYTFAVPEMEGYFFNGWYNGNTKVSDGSGKISSWSITSNVTLTANWSQYEDYTVSLTRESCKKDNGYDPSTAGTSTDQSEHKTFELLDLVVSGCAMDANGNYYVPYGSEVKLSFEVLRNPSSLPVHTLDGASVNWTVHYLSNDSYTGEVYGTNIDGEKVGYGAYYIKVTYMDGTYTESSKVNFLSGASKGSLVEATLDVDSTKTIKTIEVVAVYELYYNYMSSSWDWDGTACYSNWRLSTTLNFTTSN